MSPCIFSIAPTWQEPNLRRRWSLLWISHHWLMLCFRFSSSAYPLATFTLDHFISQAGLSRLMFPELKYLPCVCKQSFAENLFVVPPPESALVLFYALALSAMMVLWGVSCQRAEVFTCRVHHERNKVESRHEKSAEIKPTITAEYSRLRNVNSLCSFTPLPSPPCISWCLQIFLVLLNWNASVYKTLLTANMCRWNLVCLH